MLHRGPPEKANQGQLGVLTEDLSEQALIGFLKGDNILFSSIAACYKERYLKSQSVACSLRPSVYLPNGPPLAFSGGHR